MNIRWFTKHPNSHADLLEPEDGSAELILGGQPDWIRLPEDLGGTTHRVVAFSNGPCICDDDHIVRHWALDNATSKSMSGDESRIIVCECYDEFLWYRRNPDPIEDNR